jgi:hypothetical protein
MCCNIGEILFNIEQYQLNKLGRHGFITNKCFVYELQMCSIAAIFMIRASLESIIMKNKTKIPHRQNSYKI